jgi:hypothetical protein
MKYFNGLNMGEGIAGPSTIGMSTTVIYTCMGIAFVDRHRRFGGLYHYPAASMNNSNVTGSMRQMANDIQPDEIVLTPASSMGFGDGSRQDDIEAVTEFLQSLCGTVNRAAPAGAAQLIWRDSEPIFNRQPEGLDPVAISVTATTRITMSTGGRELEANIWYYGGDGETPGVLQQGLKTTKQGAKGRCVLF